MNWQEMRVTKELISEIMKRATYEQKLELQEYMDNKIPLKVRHRIKGG